MAKIHRQRSRNNPASANYFPMGPERQAAFSPEGRVSLAETDTLSMPHSRPMSSIGKDCHELRINDRNSTWRIIYRIDPNAILLLDMTEQTPKKVLDACRKRIKLYDME